MTKLKQALIPFIWNGKSCHLLGFFLFILFFIPPSSILAYNPVDSLLTLLTTTLESKEKVDILNSLSNDLIRVNPQKSFDYAQKAIVLSKESDYLKGQCVALVNLAGAETIIGEKSKALLYANKAIQLAEINQIKAALADAYHKKGVIYYFMGLYAESIQNYQEALYLNRSLNRKEKIYTQLNNIAITKRQLKEYESALKYLELSFIVAQELNKKKFIASYYTNKGFIFLDKKDYPKALSNCEKAIQVHQSSKDSLSKCINYRLIAESKLGLGELEEALHHIGIAKVISEKINYKDGILNAIRIRSAVFLQQKDYKKSIIEATKGLVLSDSLATKLNRQPILNILVTSYKALKQADIALEYQEQLLLLKDSTSNREREKLIDNLYLKYAEQKEAKLEIERKRDQQKIHQLEQKNKIKLLGLILVFSFLSLLTFAFRQSKKKNYLLQKDLANKAIIEKQAAELQQVDQLKSRLFANISHELRTPLTLINGPIKQLISNNNLSERSLQQLQIVAANSHQLIQLTNQISELSKNDLGSNKAQIAKFYFHELLAVVIPSFVLVAKNKRIDLVKPIYIEENITLISDPEKLFTIIKNLLDNAIKYTSPGGKVSLSYFIKEDNLQINVVDTGKGIASTDLPYIFERYYQTKADKFTPAGGLGIGLAICKEYVNIIKGNISVTSTLAQGSSFTLQVPISMVDKKDLSNIPFHSFSACIRATKQAVTLVEASNPIELLDHLLIVEDNIEMRHYLKTVLKQDYTLSFASNGQKALEHLAKNRPCLIITDLRMPVMNGLQLVEHLKEKKDFGDIPILMLTASTTYTDQQTALRIGVDDYLLKPFDEVELKAHITHLCNISEDKREIAECIIEQEHSISNFKPLNKASQDWLSKLEEAIHPLLGQFDLNLDHVAALMYTSKTQLNRKVKETTGMTPKRYINELRFREARRLLESKEQSTVKGTAYSVGFKSLKYFARNFKKRYGKYPSDYISSTR